MDTKSNKFSLLVLGLTAIVLSRGMFAFFNDPEGPNLLVVGVMAAVIYLASLLVAYFYTPQTITGPKRLLLTIVVQVLLVVVLYFVLK